MTKIFRLLTIFVCCAVWLQADVLRTSRYRADISPENVVPPLMGVESTGVARIDLHIRRDDQLNILSVAADCVIVFNLDSAETITGIVVGAGQAGELGTPIVSCGPAEPASVPAGAGTLATQVGSTDTETLQALDLLLENPQNFFVAVTSESVAAGLMRGQLEPLRPDLFLASVMAAPGAEGGTTPAALKGQAVELPVGSTLLQVLGSPVEGPAVRGSVTVNTDYLFEGAVNITGLQLYRGQPSDGGTVALEFAVAPTQDEDGEGSIISVKQIVSEEEQQVLSDLFNMASDFYINLETSDGAIEGQMQNTDFIVYQVPISPSNEVPPVEGLVASGFGSITFFVSNNADGLARNAAVVFSVNHYFPGPTTFNGLHIHSGFAADNGPVVVNSGLVEKVDPDGLGNIGGVNNVGPQSQAELDNLRAAIANPAAFYLNLHTTDNPAGAARGQLAAPQLPNINTGGIVNAAPGPPAAAAAPGGLITIFGVNLSEGTVNPTAGEDLPTELAGAQVMIGGRAAPFTFASPLQLNVQVPFEFAPGTQAVTVTTAGGESLSENVDITTTASGIFVITDLDFQPVTEANPVAAGDAIIIWATGLGSVAPVVDTGALGTFDPLSRVAAQLPVTVGGLSAEVIGNVGVYAPDFAGAYQLAIFVPDGAPAGMQDVIIDPNGTPSNAMPIWVQ